MEQGLNGCVPGTHRFQPKTIEEIENGFLEKGQCAKCPWKYEKTYTSDLVLVNHVMLREHGEKRFKHSALNGRRVK